MRSENDFMSNELRKIRDESLKNNLIKHTQLLQTTKETESFKDYKFHYNQRYSN